MPEIRNPGTVHAPLARYAHQIRLDGASRILVMSGQVGMTADGQVPDDVAEQFDVALSNVVRNLEDAGLSGHDLVKVTIYLTENFDPRRRAEILAGWLGDHTPCMTLVIVAGLASPALKVEIDAWAA